MKQLWREIQAEYREHDIVCQIGNLTMNMICPHPESDYPALTSHIKGAQARCLTRAVCAVFGMRGRINPAKADYSVMDHEVWLVIKSLATFYEVLMKNHHDDKWQYSTHDVKVIDDSIITMMIMYRTVSYTHLRAHET